MSCVVGMVVPIRGTVDLQCISVRQKEAERERDELLAALVALVAAHDSVGGYSDTAGRSALTAARSLIAIHEAVPVGR